MSSSAKSMPASSSAISSTSDCFTGATRWLSAPPIWLAAWRAWVSVCASIRSRTASACVRSIRPERNARCVNSPGSARPRAQIQCAAQKEFQHHRRTVRCDLNEIFACIRLGAQRKLPTLRQCCGSSRRAPSVPVASSTSARRACACSSGWRSATSCAAIDGGLRAAEAHDADAAAAGWRGDGGDGIGYGWMNPWTDSSLVFAVRDRPPPILKRRRVQQIAVASGSRSSTINRCRNCPRLKPSRAACTSACAATASTMSGSARIPSLSKHRAARQAKGLEGRIILAVHRTGKHIVFELGSADAARKQKRKDPAPEAAKSEAAKVDAQWIVHLGMTGRLLVTKPERPIAKHTHARLTLKPADTSCDSSIRGDLAGSSFARLAQTPHSRLRDQNRSTSADASSTPCFANAGLPIKAALLNQTLLAGVGNIYADESLFRAGIRPRRRTNRSPHRNYDRLRLALRRCTSHAIRLGGSSVSDYVDADGERGFFQLEHCVYLAPASPADVQDANQAIAYRGPRNSLLPELSAVISSVLISSWPAFDHSTTDF